MSAVVIVSPYQAAADHKMRVWWAVKEIEWRPYGHLSMMHIELNDQLRKHVHRLATDHMTQRQVLSQTHREALDTLLLGGWEGSWDELVEVSGLL